MGAGWDVRQAAALLGIPDKEEEEPEYTAARNVIRDTVKRSDKNLQGSKQHFETKKLIDQWLVFRLAEVRSRSITAGTFDNNRSHLEAFADFCPDIRNADGLKFLEFRAELQGKIAEGGSPYSQRDRLATVKNFLEWCGDTAKVIEPITILRKRGTGIKVPTKRIITVWDVVRPRKKMLLLRIQAAKSWPFSLEGARGWHSLDLLRLRQDRHRGFGG